jgi:hypothetical protein
VKRLETLGGTSLLAILVAAAAIIGVRTPASAVPTYATQTGLPCQTCHVGGFGPQLTPFGRAFKLGGYTLRADGANLPLSAMAVASATSTAKAQPSPPADGFSDNRNVAFDQGSIFLAGGIGSHFGGFVQTTYDGVAKAWSWDNMDLRVVGTGKIGGKDLVYGLTLNNNPSVQDAWNTLPAWGYPYTSSALAPGAAASPLIDGALAQNVLGVTGYAWIDSKFYVEAGGYASPAAGTLSWLGADPLDPGSIHGLAPYGRLAFQSDLAGGSFEAGAFALKAALLPGRDRSTGLSDHYSDVGIDASWIRTLASSDVLTFNARYTHEKRALDASCTLAMAAGSIATGPLSDCASGSLNEVRGDASYYWRNTVGATIGAFDISGSPNAMLYPDNKGFLPESSGIQLQFDATPFGSSNSPLGKRFNLRIGVQYTAYLTFDGASTNYDGTARNASDNNTLRFFTWIAF